MTLTRGVTGSVVSDRERRLSSDLCGETCRYLVTTRPPLYRTSPGCPAAVARNRVRGAVSVRPSDRRTDQGRTPVAWGS